MTQFLRQALRQEPEMYLVETVAEFCTTYRTTHRRIYFLQVVLLSTDSCFRQFTYFCNGRSGNISSHEDVLDRILSFLG